MAVDKPYIIAENFHIKPSDIDTNKPFMGAFGKLGMEVFASIIVRMCQYIGYWDAFTRKQIEDCCIQRGANAIFLERFMEQNLMICDVNGGFCVTEEFVRRCYEAAPKKK